MVSEYTCTAINGVHTAVRAAVCRSRYHAANDAAVQIQPKALLANESAWRDYTMEELQCLTSSGERLSDSDFLKKFRTFSAEFQQNPMNLLYSRISLWNVVKFQKPISDILKNLQICQSVAF